MSAPSAILIRHRKERKSKCTLQPLVDREGFDFYTFPGNLPEISTNYIRLAVGAPMLSPKDSDKGILLLDGTWKLVEPMNERYSHVEARSLPILQTAYPRVSKVFEDPDGGLASIEALALSYALLGREWRSLLDGYHWQADFLRLNASMLDQL